MKTATIEDLQHRLATVFSWLEAGEDVVVKSAATKPVAPFAPAKVDWTKSAAFQRDRTGEPVLSQQDLDELFEHMRGPY